MNISRSFFIVIISLLSTAFAAQVTLYKSPTCGCCTDWANILEAHGHEIDTKNILNLDKKKALLGVPKEMGSCHTAVINGFLFEGHVPIADIESFLANPPAGVRGLAVPGMPMMSPGMAPEGETYRDFKVMGFDDTGKFFLYNQY